LRIRSRSNGSDRGPTTGTDDERRGYSVADGGKRLSQFREILFRRWEIGPSR
jgi:hypothetical protein